MNKGLKNKTDQLKIFSAKNGGKTASMKSVQFVCEKCSTTREKKSKRKKVSGNRAQSDISKDKNDSEEAQYVSIAQLKSQLESNFSENLR